jgi:SAM-dependent methyltransferase
LEKDGLVAGREGLKIELVRGDMKDLSVFKNKSFDLIFHPVSNCFIDDVQPVWKECYRVLKKGGVLLSGFCNPLLFIFDFDIWDRNSKLKVKYKIPYSDLEQLPKAQLNKRIKNLLPLEYGHSLQSQIGGQLKAGFLLADFYEDNAGGDLLDKHINTFIATKAVKL